MNISIALCLIVVSATVAQAVPTDAPEASPNPYVASLERLRPPELPPRAARIVADKSEKDQADTARLVVLAAYDVNSASLLAVVGAVSRSTPSVAHIAAATATRKQPSLARFAARAAAVAAPAEVSRIVETVGREVPSEASEIAIFVGTAVADSDRAAIEGLSKVSQAWDLALDEAQRDLPTADQTVAKVVIRAKRIMENADSDYAVLGPSPTPGATRGPPFQPLTGTPTVIIPNGDSAVPPDWERDYSRP